MPTRTATICDLGTRNPELGTGNRNWEFVADPRLKIQGKKEVLRVEKL